MHGPLSRGISTDFVEAARYFLSAQGRAALTGAGISVSCGVPDFRGDHGIWSRFDPERFATLEVFLSRPDRAWQFYRELGRILRDKEPGAAHRGLAQLESAGLLDGVVTQNIDGLHRDAGSRRVFEIHGEYRHLQCLDCFGLQRSRFEHFESSRPPVCPTCGSVVKPNVVLFGEEVRQWSEAEAVVDCCEVLLIVGTSGSVLPVAALPRRVLRRGGGLIEFNLEGTPLSSQCRFHFRGPVEATLPRFVAAIRELGGFPADSIACPEETRAD